MYISLTDCVQHRAAPGETEANVMLSQIDEFIGKFIRGGARIGITADHGMNYKIKPDGTPNIIYLEDMLSGFEDKKIRVVLPITDPYTSHHAALGSFAMIYCTSDNLESIRKMLITTEGVLDILTKFEACEKYSLPTDRIGELVVFADKQTVFGKTPEFHDLSQLKGRLRSHGSLSETAVPFILSGKTDENPQKEIKNRELYDYLINRCK